MNKKNNLFEQLSEYYPLTPDEIKSTLDRKIAGDEFVSDLSASELQSILWNKIGEMMLND